MLWYAIIACSTCALSKMSCENSTLSSPPVDGGYEVDTPPNIRNARAQAHEETESETEQKDAQEESVYLEIPKQS